MEKSKFQAPPFPDPVVMVDLMPPLGGRPLAGPPAGPAEEWIAHPGAAHGNDGEPVPTALPKGHGNDAAAEDAWDSGPTNKGESSL